MKKWFLCIFTLLILLAGCVAPQESTGGVNLPTGGGEIAIPTADYDFYINISSENEWDIRISMDAQLTYMTLTKEPLAAGEYVSMSGFSGIEKQKTACEDAWMNEFPFWLYQTYRGVDWNEVAAITQAAQNGDTAAQQQLAAYETLYLADYQALTTADIPQVNAYWITNIPEAYSYNQGYDLYTALTRTFQVAEQEIELNVGTFHCYYRGWDQILSTDGIDGDVYMGRLETASTTYWGDGRVTLEPIQLAASAYPQKLEAMELYGIHGDILAVEVTYGETVFYWDGIAPLEIPAETAATLVVTLQTEVNQTVGYCEDANLMLRCEKNGKTERLWYFASITQSWNKYELYAMMVDGLDIGAYYAYKTGWTEPAQAEQHEKTEIAIEPAEIAKAKGAGLTLTGISWDEEAYYLHFDAENKTDKYTTFGFSDTYINGYYFRPEPNFDALLPGESRKLTWRLSWEVLREFGIDAASGQDIFSLEFSSTPIFNGYPADVDPYYLCVYPLGEAAVQVPAAEGMLLLETENFRIYALDFCLESMSALSALNKIESDYWLLTLRIENTGDLRTAFTSTEFTINETVASGVLAQVVKEGRCSYHRIVLKESNAMGTQTIQDPKTLTFTLTVGGKDTYEITVDLTALLQG